MRRAWRWLLGLLLLAVLAGLAWRGMAERRAQQAAALATPAAESVVQLAPSDVVRVARRELTQGVPFSGTLRAVDSAMLKARVPGELKDLVLREGDPVRAGQVVARIEPDEYQSRLRQAREQAESARAQVEVAQRAFDNNQALVAQGFISRTALETSQSNLNAARATHRAALAAVELARKSLDDTVLRSPIDGQVAQRLAQPGERVGVDARILEVIDLRRIEVEATLAAADSVDVRAGQRATLRIEGGATPARRAGATVSRVNPSAQAGSRSVLAYLRLDPGEGFRQGLFARGEIELGRMQLPTLPLSAVRTDQPRPYVQVIVDGRVVHRPVEPGLRGSIEGEPFVAVSGVEEGTPVIAGSVGPMREGTAVRTAAP